MDEEAPLAPLKTETILYERLADLQSASGEGAKAALLAAMLLEVFNDYYARSRRIPWLAKQAFEARDWRRSVQLSQERIGLFADSVHRAVPVLKHSLREFDRIGGFWNTVEERYRDLVGTRYEGDLAMAHLASIRRGVYRDTWTPVDYEKLRAPSPLGASEFVTCLPAEGRMTQELISQMLELLGLKASFRDHATDCALAAELVNRELGLDEVPDLEEIEVVSAGFYRNRGAYLVGGVRRKSAFSPISLALLHDADGIYIDAVLFRETTLRHVFSPTLANFHVTVTQYHELVDYLCKLMPTRPRGLHYSTVGYNHVGKLAVVEQLSSGLDQGSSALDFAPGPRGSVAIGFTAPQIDYVLKVIRDTPTESYKWESYDGAEAVLSKYRLVHKINRSGSMLDNIIYSNLSLPRDWFGPALLDELMTAADGSVSLHRDQIFFRHMIAQRKLTPVPLYLQSCSPEAAEIVTLRLGQCIRNNASSNVFNRDLDGRNYGVSSLRFVYLFDYDAVERLTDIQIHSNLDREPGEEDIPDWFFEEGPVFLPEELEAHLRLPDRHLKRVFRQAHGELLTPDYWTRMQALHQRGIIPRVRSYPRSAQLRPPDGVIYTEAGA